MAFGNPYYDEYNYSIVNKWIGNLRDIGIDRIVLSDTVGIGKTEDIYNVFNSVIPDFPDVEFGAHLHSASGNWRSKIEAAYKGGCRMFDGALGGIGVAQCQEWIWLEIFPPRILFIFGRDGREYWNK